MGMDDLIFPEFYKMHPELVRGKDYTEEFVNSDETLHLITERVEVAREKLGLVGLVGDLEAIVINVEDDKLEGAARELVNSTNYHVFEGYINPGGRYIILRCNGSSDIIIKSNLTESNMFRAYNINPKSLHLPNTRLETFVFECFNIKKYVELQRLRGVKFATQEVVEMDNYLFIQTVPSSFTGNSIGLLQWKGKRGEYKSLGDSSLGDLDFMSGEIFLKNIGKLDHAATRVRARDRDSALIEFMELTNYQFAFSIYVNSLNSITNVATLKGAKYAAVFTSGIKPYIDEQSSGPTEKFIHNYGIRVHHIAFETEDIDYTYNSLRRNNYGFMSEVVGSEAKGIKQAFTEPSPNTLLVNEYVSRYGSFKGFFIEENVTLLTKATENQ